MEKKEEVVIKRCKGGYLEFDRPLRVRGIVKVCDVLRARKS